ncbi:FliM/FliN family flagellar motor switch protein [Yoonia sp.]|uniref:FliM/FliN family flagellar motor switch protein n=1 Tax=Yoonia sp. TaxID=2212373 RepID=UPI0025D461AA|nr:FliM/FliN family flagellar motor switch protein [Yoonia sp.]
MGKHSEMGTAVAVITPYQWPALPEIHPVEPALLRVLPSKPQSLSLPIGNVEIELRGPVSVPLGQDQFVTKVEIGDEIVEVWATTDMLTLALGLSGLDDNIADYPVGAHPIILEYLLMPILGSLANALNTPTVSIAHHAAPQGRRRAAGIGLALSIPELGEHTAVVTGSETLLLRIASLWKSDRMGHGLLNLKQIPFDCVLRGQNFEIMRQDADLLTPGDMLLIDQAWFEAADLRLQVANASQAQVSAIAAGMKFSAEFKTIKRKRQMQTQQDAEANALDLPVTVSIELARKQMKLSELEKMAIGAVVPFDIEQMTEVVLTANGLQLARGELVKVDQQMAIRITEVN